MQRECRADQRESPGARKEKDIDGAGGGKGGREREEEEMKGKRGEGC